MKLKPDTRQDLQRGAARGAPARSSDVPGLTLGLTEAGPVRPEADPDQRARRRDRRARPHLARAGAGDAAKIPGVADIETSLEKSKPELRVRRRPPARQRPRHARRRRSRTTLQAGGGRRGGDDDRGPRAATTTTCACGCAPISGASPRTCCALSVPTDKDDDNRRQDPDAARRGGDGRARHRPVHDPPPGPACARCASRPTPTAARCSELVERHRGGGRAARSCRRATTSCRAATPKS